MPYLMSKMPGAGIEPHGKSKCRSGVYVWCLLPVCTENSISLRFASEHCVSPSVGTQKRQLGVSPAESRKRNDRTERPGHHDGECTARRDPVKAFRSAPVKAFRLAPT